MLIYFFSLRLDKVLSKLRLKLNNMATIYVFIQIIFPQDWYVAIKEIFVVYNLYTWNTCIMDKHWYRRTDQKQYAIGIWSYGA